LTIALPIQLFTRKSNFLPSNTTSVTQLMDQDVIRSSKAITENDW